MRDGKTGISDAKGIDPADLWIEPQHLLKGVKHPGKQHKADEKIKPGIVQHGLPELAMENRDQQAHQHQKNEHAPHIEPRRRQAPMQRGWSPIHRSCSRHASFSASIGATLTKDVRTTNRQLDAMLAQHLAASPAEPAGARQPPAEASATAGARRASANSSKSALCMAWLAATIVPAPAMAGPPSPSVA